MPARAQNVANARPLRFSGRLAVEQLPQTQSRVERRPELVAHPGKKIALRLVRTVGFFLGLAQRNFDRLPLGNVFDHHEEMLGLALVVADDAGSPADPEDAAVLVEVAL